MEYYILNDDYATKSCDVEADLNVEIRPGWLICGFNIAAYYGRPITFFIYPCCEFPTFYNFTIPVIHDRFVR